MSAPPPLAPGVRQALDAIRVDPGLRRATVGGHQVVAGDTGGMATPLATAVYEILHVGRSEPLALRVRSLRDRAFELRLAAATPHETTRTPARFVRTDGSDMIIELDGVRVRLPERSGLDRTGSVVGVPAARPGLSPGFFLVDGSAGRSRSTRLLRVYVHLRSAEEVPQVWQEALRHLEEAGLRYRAKVTSLPALLPRRDGLVLYLDPADAEHASSIADALSDQPGVGDETSCFTERLARGVATADEPDDPRPGLRRLSFGEHRARALATALVCHAADPAGQTLEACVHEAFQAAGIDPAAPARNLAADAVAAAGG